MHELVKFISEEQSTDEYKFSSLVSVDFDDSESSEQPVKNAIESTKLRMVML